METQLQQALATILNQSMDAVQAGVSFLQAEIPDVIRQLLLWKMASAGMTVVFAGIGVLIALYVLRRCYAVISKYQSAYAAYRFGYGDAEREAAQRMREVEDFQLPAWIATTLGVIFIAAMAPVAICNAKTIVQIWIAPKVYLIEYAASLVSK